MGGELRPLPNWFSANWSLKRVDLWPLSLKLGYHRYKIDKIGHLILSLILMFVVYSVLPGIA